MGDGDERREADRAGERDRRRVVLLDLVAWLQPAGDELGQRGADDERGEALPAMGRAGDDRDLPPAVVLEGDEADSGSSLSSSTQAKARSSRSRVFGSLALVALLGEQPEHHHPARRTAAAIGLAFVPGERHERGAPLDRELRRDG